jgi:hypothetical protein
MKRTKAPALRVVAERPQDLPTRRASWWTNVRPEDFASAAKREAERLRQEAQLRRRSTPS